MTVVLENYWDDLALIDMILTDSRLNWDTRGVAIFCVRQGEGWHFRVEDLTRSRDPHTIKHLQNVLNVLARCGYLQAKSRQRYTFVRPR